MHEKTTAVSFEDSELTLPSPPRFDQDASTRARPVTPLPKKGVAGWLGTSQGLQRLARPARLVALILIGGLAAAALGRMLMVREGHLREQSLPVVEHTPDLSGPTVQNGMLPAADVTGGLHTVSKPEHRFRERRMRFRFRHVPRAFRVFILRGDDDSDESGERRHGHRHGRHGDDHDH